MVTRPGSPPPGPRAIGHPAPGDPGSDPSAPPLVESKLRRPVGPRRRVSRPRLEPAYRRAAAAPLTVVSGPAGCGKTVAALELAETLEQPTAWVSLDAGDDAPRFWPYVVEALRRTLPDVDAGAAVTAIASRPTGSAPFLGELLDLLDRVVAPVVLVLHDLDRVTDRRVLDDVAFLVEHAPSALHVVVVTRAVLPWPLARWRVSDELNELDGVELRFRGDEVGALLATTEGLELADDDVELLADRTEGWAAGLRLAALSLAGHAERAERADAVRRFDGDDGMIVDYFEGEVLDREPPEVRDFLLATAVLDRFDAELCRSVTGRPDAGELLEHAVDANLFVVPLDARREWFRYHRLFAAALRHELTLHAPERVPALHRAAATTHASHGDPGLAVRHLVASGAPDEAFELVVAERDDEAEVEQWRGGWLDRFPAGFVAEDLGRMLDLAGALLADGRFEESELWIERAGRALERAGEHREPQAHLLALSAVCRAGRGDAERAVEEGLAALEAREGEDALLDRLPVHLARSFLLLDDLAGAERMCERLTASDLSDTLSMLLRPAICARIAAREGDLRRGDALAQRVVVAAGRLGAQNHSATLDARLAQATVELDRDRLPEAEGALDHVRDLARRRNAIPYAVLAHLERARVVAARAGAADALAELATARRLEELARGQALARRVDAAEARFCIDAGELGRAAALLRFLPAGPGRTLLEARFDLASGFPDVARARVAGTTFANRRDRLAAALLTARSLVTGDRAAAERALARALDLAAPEGFVRVFLEEGREVAALLRPLVRSAPSPANARLVSALTGRSVPSGERSGEPFSERERAVLRYLPSRLTNQEIAGELFISLNTLKTHLKSIYRKLDAGSRAEAVAAARRSGLL